MRASWLIGLGAWAAVGGIGCSQSGPNLRPPVEEQYVLPPTDDGRFSEPITYPKETLNREPIKPAAPGKLPSQQPRIAPGGSMGGRMNPGGF